MGSGDLMLGEVGLKLMRISGFLRDILDERVDAIIWIIFTLVW